MELSLQRLSEDFLLRMKKQEESDDLISALATYDYPKLLNELVTDEQKKAFWINCYNAFFLYLRRNEGLTKPAVFRDKVIVVAGQALSLDDIEHGILRRYRWKWSLGYLPHPFPSKVIRQLAVDRLDARIHFALNCGANSCPPIAFYQVERVEQQLQMALASFLEAEVHFSEETREIQISKLFQWYQGDFGGKRGIMTLLQEQLELVDQNYSLRFTEYDWTENLDNFALSK